VKILYLEDNQQDATLVSRYVQTTPHDLVVANNLKAAREAVSQSPELIMVDLILGRTREGFNFVRELRAQGYTHPVIAITALSTSKDLDECKSVGVDYVLNKPFTINRLAEVIHQYTS
jgi:CheY-like chemotaxis protein